MHDGPVIPNLQRLLVPLDGSPWALQAVPLAMRLASPGGTITLLGVAPDTGITGDAGLDQLEFVRADQASRYPAVAVEIMLASGDPADEIIDAANHRNADLIVMATYESQLRGRAAADTVSGQVASRSHVPVLVAPAAPACIDPLAPASRFERIVVPFDGSPRASHTLPIAVAMARACSAPVHLVTVVDAQASLPPAYTYSSAEHDPDRMTAEIALRAQGAAALMAGEREVRCAGIETTAELLSGSTLDCILDALRPGDLVVMATRDGGSGSENRLGRVAQGVLQETTTPVVAFQPVVADAVSMCATDWESVIPELRTNHS